MPSPDEPHQQKLVFAQRKRQILDELNSPLPDLSPKGGPDVQILPLLELINRHEDLVSTSSCAGRVAVYAEGVRAKGVGKNGAGRRGDDGDDEQVNDDDEELAQAPAVLVGGKGSGGRWLYVTHDAPLAQPDFGKTWSEFLYGGLKTTTVGTDADPRDTLQRRYVHFKFEPLILHVLCADYAVAMKLLGIALAAGFRESGYNGNILAIRCSLRIDSPVGFLSPDDEDAVVPLVDDTYLAHLMAMASERFTENKRRTDRLFASIEKSMGLHPDAAKVESKEERRIRKRAEGLRKQQEMLREQTLKQEHEQ
ncbi:tRNA wybutosine-synthesizing protein [Myxozyma melibiosi]|uniref:tRNA(Phe) 7-[(3-amino-3-carboxypropyl)-4-demethylwyosine(37)-N(4)]-methyltransferase n=1 Tax=Myxozyma melibiosi TaxID=54550 RepID=A0ABR1FA11_9ASCO